ncbi:hypothetical protein ES703_113536 [subsurface metagenome]
MNLPQGRKPVNIRWSVSHGPFLAASVLAIVLASVFITIGWFSGSGGEYSYTIPAPEVPDIKPSPTPTIPNSPDIEPQPTLPTPDPPAAILRKTKGLPIAPVTFIVYSDFQCSHCQVFALTIEKQLETSYINTGKILFVFKHIIAYGQESLLAAEAAEAANEQGKFWPYHNLLMQVRASPRVEDDLSISVLQNIAQQIGLDMEAFNASIQSGKYRDSVLQESQEGKSLGVTVIPTFYINGAKKEGAKSFEELQVIIDEIL